MKTINEILPAILNIYSNKPFWLFLTIFMILCFLTFMFLKTLKNGFKIGKLVVPGFRNKKEMKNSLKNPIEYLSKEKHLLYMKDLHDVIKKINDKRTETLKKQINIGLNITFRLNSFQFDFIKDLIEKRYKEQNKNIKSALKTIAYWYAKDIINQLNTEHLKAIINLIINNGLDQMTSENFYEYIDSKLKDADSSIKERLKNESNNTEIEFFDDKLILEIIASDTYKKILNEIKETIISIRHKAFEKKEEIEKLIVIQEKLLNYEIDDNENNN